LSKAAVGEWWGTWTEERGRKAWVVTAEMSAA